MSAVDRFRRPDGIVEVRTRPDPISTGMFACWMILLVAVTVMLLVSRPDGWWAGLLLVVVCWVGTVLGAVGVRRSALLIDTERRRVGRRRWSADGTWWTPLDRVVDQSRIVTEGRRGASRVYWVLWTTEGGMSRSAARGPGLNAQSLAHLREREQRGWRPFTIVLSSLGDDGAAVAKALIGQMVPGLAWG